jgi:chitinase
MAMRLVFMLMPALMLAGCSGTTGDVLITHDLGSPGDLSNPALAPTVGIDHPADGTVVLAGNHVSFVGHASDPTNGALSGAALVWSSSIDGILGSGAMLTTAALHAGTHTITLTATDSLGLSASAQIQLIAQ